MSSKATIGFLIGTVVAFLISAGVWAQVRTERVHPGASKEAPSLEQIVQASKREQRWFNAMFVSGNLALIFLAHFGALRHRRRMAFKRINS